jgi:hypothetical protein
MKTAIGWLAAILIFEFFFTNCAPPATSSLLSASRSKSASSEAIESCENFGKNFSLVTEQDRIICDGMSGTCCNRDTGEWWNNGLGGDDTAN